MSRSTAPRVVLRPIVPLSTRQRAARTGRHRAHRDALRRRRRLLHRRCGSSCVAAAAAARRRRGAARPHPRTSHRAVRSGPVAPRIRATDRLYGSGSSPVAGADYTDSGRPVKVDRVQVGRVPSRPSRPPPGKYSLQRRVTVAAVVLVAGAAPRGSRASGARRSGSAPCRRRGCARARVAAAWMSAAGSKRVNVVHRKFIALRAARARLVGQHEQRPAREGGMRGEARGGRRAPRA